MNELLNKAIAAHGGWSRWQRIRRLTAEATIGGAVWSTKGKGGLFEDVRTTIDPHRPHAEYAPFRAPGQQSVWEPERTAIENERRLRPGCCRDRHSRRRHRVS